MKNILNIILLGPQGSGKGTQAKLLARDFGFKHIEIGKVLRKISKKETNLGKRVARIINQGNMVPISMISEIVGQELKKVSKDQGIIFDGTPRRLGEIKPLKENLAKHERKITHVFFISISKQESIKRLKKRKICLNCGTPFIIGETINKDEVICPICGGEVVVRRDETPESIKKRLALYRKKTDPVVNYFKKENKLIKINGEDSINNVYKEIKSYL